jgi:hypothetical protein
MVATVSAVCIGRMFSSGVDGKQDESVLRAMLDQAGMDRTNEARGSAPHLEHLVSTTREEAQAFAPKSMMREGYDRAARIWDPLVLQFVSLRSP